MDTAKIESLAERLTTEVNAGMSCLNLYIGHRLGLYKALADAGPVTPGELAGETGYNERYICEWLECMAAGGYLDCDHASGRFSLSPEHAVVFLDLDSPAYCAAFFCWLPSLAGVLDPLLEAFRSGGGVEYEAYGNDTLEAIGMGNRPMFVNDYATKWIPTMPDVEVRLKSGGRVADIGCGLGWSCVSLAQGFPKTKIDAIDMDAESIEQARDIARQAGVADRITFHATSAEDAPLKESSYDLVTVFECIHDMAYPVKALRRMRELLAPGGAVLVSEEAVEDSLEENSNFFGHMMYNFSVLHCLPQSMCFPDTAAIGTVMAPSKLRGFAKEAGFNKVDVLPIDDNPFWRFYRLTP